MYYPNEFIKCGSYYKVCIYDKNNEVKAFSLIDIEDKKIAQRHKWSIDRQKYTKSGCNGKTIFLHVLILGGKKGLVVDHINRNPLDNRKNNLRHVTKSEDLINRKKYKNNTSGAVGVYYKKDKNKWEARIKRNNTDRYLGEFNKKEDAIIARYIAEQLWDKQ